MVYKGSKIRIAKYLKPIIENYIDDETIYIEPFCGGANMIDKINHSLKYAYDVNPYLIALHKKNKTGKIEYQFINKDLYLYVKNNKQNFSDWFVGYVGFIYSFQAEFFSSYYYKYFDGNKERDKSKENFNNLIKQSLNEQYKNIIFEAKDYRDIKLNENEKYVIYLDPPYNNTSGYNKEKFNHNNLWEQCIKWKKQNPNVVILLSELEAPNNLFYCIWTKETNHFLTVGGKKQVVEKLFIYKGE